MEPEETRWMNWDAESDGQREDPLEPWFQAARDGDTATILAWLRNGSDVDVRGANGGTVLMVAAWHEHVDLIRILLNHGARLDVEDGDGYSPMGNALERALFRDNPSAGSETIAMLREAGGQFGLREAVMLNDVDLARQRLDEGADPNVGKGSYFGPLLMIASLRGFPDMVRLLLERGAKTEGKDDLGQSPLILAADLGFAEIVSCLLDHGADIDYRDGYNQSALATAVLKRHDEVVALLLSRGARRSLLDAVALGDEAIVRAGLAAGADPNEIGLGWWSRPTARSGTATESAEYTTGRLLRFAVSRGNLSIVRQILEYDDGITRELFSPVDDWTPLIEAVRCGFAEITRLLIERGLDIHAVDPGGRTPLAWARQLGHDDIVALLERAGATR